MQYDIILDERKEKWEVLRYGNPYTTSELPKYVFLSKFKLLWGNISNMFFVLHVNFANSKTYTIEIAFIESNEINGVLNEFTSENE